MRIKIFFVALFLVGALLLLYKQHGVTTLPVQSFSSFKEINIDVKQCDDTIVFFDVDDTLMYGPYIFPRNVWCRLLFRLYLIVRHPSFIKQSVWEHYYSIMWQQADRFLIDQYSVELIESLKKNGCVVLGLTSMETGAYGVIADMPEWRYAMLAHMGIVFDQRFGTMIFDNIASYRNNYPMLYKGIICTNQTKKGKVVDAFLQRLDKKPKRIIFFDDSQAALESVGSTCHAHHIECILYKSEGYKQVEQPWHWRKATEQINSLVNYAAWSPV